MRGALAAAPRRSTYSARCGCICANAPAAARTGARRRAKHTRRCIAPPCARRAVIGSIVRPMKLREIVAGFWRSFGRRSDRPSESDLRVHLCGRAARGAADGRAVLAGRRLLAVADLHLEKGSSYAVNARKLLPRHDTRQTLGALAALIDALQPRDGRLPRRFLPRPRRHRAPAGRGARRDRAADRGARASSGSPAITIPRRRPPAGARSRRRSARPAGVPSRGAVRPGRRARSPATIIPSRRSRCGAAACGGAAS